MTTCILSVSIISLSILLGTTQPNFNLHNHTRVLKVIIFVHIYIIFVYI